jgi:hypothetical protein
MKRFLLGRELPAIFTVSLVGAVFAFENGQPAFGGWLLVAALWCFILWLILLSQRPEAHARAQPDERQNRRDKAQRQKRCRTA